MSEQPSKPTKKERAAQRSERAAALLMEQRRRERRRRTLSVVGVVVAVLAIVAGLFAITQLQGDGQPGGSDAPAAGTTDYGFVTGPDDAPHQVVVYEDFLCPICGALEGQVGEKLDELTASGDVQLDVRPIAILTRFGDYSTDAANAFFVVRDASSAEVTDEFHDLLFENQPAEQGPFPTREDLLALAVKAGADESAVRDGILDGSADKTVEEATEAATDAGVSGTPTVLVDGEVVPGSTIDEVAANLLEEVEPSS